MNRLEIEILVFLFLSMSFGLWLHARDVRFEKQGIQKQAQVQKEAATKQKEIDDQKIKEAGEQYAKDMADIAKYNFDGGTSSVVCHTTPRRMPETPVRPNGTETTPVVASDDVVHPDIRPALEMYARLAARLQAGANRLDDEVK
jgi:hypothetical protein